MRGESLIEILRDKKLLSEREINEILKENLENQTPIVDIIVKRRLLDEDKIVELLIELSDIPFVDLDSVEVDREAVLHIPIRIQKKYLLIPVRKTSRSLAIAMSNPLDEEAMEELKTVTDLEIIPLIGKPSRIMSLIAKFEGESIGDEEITLSWEERVEKEFTFDNFKVDKSNEAAYATLIGIAKDEYGARVPVVISGPPGCGKTHLLHSVVNLRRKDDVLLLSEEELPVRIQGNIRIVLVDNVKKGERFDEFSSFVDRGGILVIATRKNPTEIRGIEGSLKIKIEPPNEKLKEAVLVKYQEVLGDEVIKFLARRDKSNLKELIGVAEALKHEKIELGREITVERAKNLLYEGET